MQFAVHVDFCRNSDEFKHSQKSEQVFARGDLSPQCDQSITNIDNSFEGFQRRQKMSFLTNVCWGGCRVERTCYC